MSNTNNYNREDLQKLKRKQLINIITRNNYDQDISEEYTKANGEMAKNLAKTKYIAIILEKQSELNASDDNSDEKVNEIYYDVPDYDSPLDQARRADMFFSLKRYIWEATPIANKLEYWQLHPSIDGGNPFLQSCRRYSDGDYSNLSNNQQHHLLRYLNKLGDVVMVFLAEGARFPCFNNCLASAKRWYNEKGNLSQKQIQAVRRTLTRA